MYRRCCSVALRLIETRGYLELVTGTGLLTATCPHGLYSVFFFNVTAGGSLWGVR